VRRAARTAGVGVVIALAAAALGITGLTAVHALRTTPLLAIREVEVRGTRHVAETAVRAAAAIEPGTNLLALDVEGLVRRVRAIPGIRRATVIRELPDRVTLVVEEREPYALVNMPGADGGLAWIDADGYLVTRERHPAVPALPILTGVEPPTGATDQPVSDRLYEGLALLRALQRVGGRAERRLSEIDLDHPGGPVLFTTDGIQVWIGEHAWDERLARLDSVLGEIDEQGQAVESVDLRFRDLVVWRPRTATQKER
jgi:cell division septal protein FtsQ